MKGLQLTSDSMKPLLMPYKGGEAARYYFQDAAIRATFGKIAQGNKKALLSLATGTGKTIIASQLLYKLAQAGQLKRALFVCDRDELRTQGNAKLHGVFGDNVQIVTTQDPQKNAWILVATYQTIIFCARDNHANQITIALNNVYEKWCKENNRSPKERYAFQCTGNPDLRPSADKLIPDFRGAKNSHFIATTVELLSTGVDIPNLGNVVFFRYLESPISFYQMVGRGTRTGEPRGSKAMFRVYDYTNTTRLFGEAFISRAKPSRPEKEPPEGTESPAHTYGKEDVPKRKIIRVGEHRFTVQIQGEECSILCVEDGKEVLIPVEEYKQQLAEKLVEEAPSIDALRQTWITPENESGFLLTCPAAKALSGWCVNLKMSRKATFLMC